MLNKKTFVYQAGLLALSNTALMLLSFAYRIILGRLAGAEGLGVHTLVMQVYTILMSVSVYGLCTALTHMTASLSTDTPGIRAAVRIAFSCFFMLLALFAIPVFFARGFIASGILGDARTASALIMVLACVLLTGIENIFKAVLFGLRLVKYTSLSEVGEQALRIALAAILLTKLGNGDDGYTALIIMFVMTLSEVYSVIVLSVAYYRRVGSGIGRASAKGNTKGSKSRTEIRNRFISLALPSTLTTILGNVFASVTVILFPVRLMLAGLTRAEAVGLLGVVSGMLMPVLLLPSSLIAAVCTLLMPSVASSTAGNDMEGMRRKVNKGIEAVSLLGIPSMMLMLPFAPIICALVFGQAVAFPLIVLMTIETVVTFYIILINSILNGLGRQRQVLLLTAAREAVQLSLVWVLAAEPSLNVYGYALGLIGGDVLHVALGFVFVHRHTDTRPNIFNAVITPVACAVVLYIAARIAFFAGLGMGLTMLGAAGMSVAICALLYLVLLRLLNIRPIAYIKRVAFSANG